MSLIQTKKSHFKRQRLARSMQLSLAGLGIFILFASSSLGLPRSTSSVITDSPKEVIDQVWQIIYRDFLDASGKYSSEGWVALRRQLLSTKYDTLDDSHEAIRGMLSSLGDPYTRFLDPKEFKEMRIDTTGELTGVGIQLSLDKGTNELIVVSPIEGTPAFRAGIKPNDVIVSIDGKSTIGMGIEQAVKLIRGRKDTKVTLGLRRSNQLIKLDLTRARIEIHAVISKLNQSNSGIDIGYIRLKQFNANASKEMRNAINLLEKSNVSGYVLDLRSNPGGLLEASVEIARLWLDEGIIVSTKTRNGINDVRRANGNALTDSPLVVLVNEGSASASEILSGAIQDNSRGILIGTKTFGKGLVQSVRGLSDGSGMTVTIAKYLTPNGTDIHKNGIYPDIESKLSDTDARLLTLTDLGTRIDPQYREAESYLLRNINVKDENNSYMPGTVNLLQALQK